MSVFSVLFLRTSLSSSSWTHLYPSLFTMTDIIKISHIVPPYGIIVCPPLPSQLDITDIHVPFRRPESYAARPPVCLPTVLTEGVESNSESVPHKTVAVWPCGAVMWIGPVTVLARIGLAYVEAHFFYQPGGSRNVIGLVANFSFFERLKWTLEIR